MKMEAIPRDTDPEVMEMLVSRWRQMSVAERGALVDQMNADVELLAIVGIRAQYPVFSDFEVRHELARRRYGDHLADEAYRQFR